MWAPRFDRDPSDSGMFTVADDLGSVGGGRGVFKEFLEAHAHLLVSVWNHLVGDLKHELRQIFRPNPQGPFG